ncbi:unnamed protein product, partial [Ectocarpus sp. 8 AP-2014]
VTYSVTSTLSSRGTDRRRNADEVAQLFPSSPRFSQILFTTPEPNYSSHEEDTNVLKKEIFDEIWSIAEKVALIEAGPKNESYDSLCYRHSTNGRCASYGVLSFWDG